MARALFAALCVAASCAQAAEPARFVSRQALADGEHVVVAEGDFEARSVGSYSIRVYEAAAAPNETTFYSSGLVLAREGTVEKVLLADVNADGQDEVIVVVRSVGSGSYLSAQAFSVSNGDVAPLVSLSDLAPDTDLLAALRDKAIVREAVKQRQVDRLKR